MSNRKSEKTILAVSGDVDVLVLMRGMLENHCRVLVAADAESALRLVTVHGIQVDLAVIDSNIAGSRRGLLRRISGILPTLRTLPMASLVEDGVIRLAGPCCAQEATFMRAPSGYPYYSAEMSRGV